MVPGPGVLGSRCEIVGVSLTGPDLPAHLLDSAKSVGIASH
jgi:hypothetical protein